MGEAATVRSPCYSDTPWGLHSLNTQSNLFVRIVPGNGLGGLLRIGCQMSVMSEATGMQESTPTVSRVAVPALVLTTVMAALAMSVANVALPQVSQSFGVSMATSQWVTLSYLVASTILIVFIGRLADMWGRGRVLLAGMGLFVVASLGAGIAPGFWELVAARALQGVAAAAMTALPMALVRETVPAERVGRTMGLLGSSMAAGMALGPALGGFVVAGPGWRAVFLMLVPLTLVAMLLAAKGLPHQPGAGSGKGVPFFDLEVIRSARILPGLALALLVALIMMTFTMVPPFYLTRALGLDNGAMGLVMAVGPLVAIIAGVPSGRLVDRVGPARVVLVGLVLLTVASLGLVAVPALIGLAGFLLFAVTITPGNQLFMAANNTEVMARAGREHQGSVSGMLNLARNLGFVVGTPVMGLVYEAAASNNAGPAGATYGLQATFALAAVAGVVALLLARRTYRAPAD